MSVHFLTKKSIHCLHGRPAQLQYAEDSELRQGSVNKVAVQQRRTSLYPQFSVPILQGREEGRGLGGAAARPGPSSLYQM